MSKYRTKLGKNGRLVIPASYRKQLQLEPGKELMLRVENNELHVFSIKCALKKAQALIKHHAKNRSLIEELKLLRQEK